MSNEKESTGQGRRKKKTGAAGIQLPCREKKPAAANCSTEGQRTASNKTSKKKSAQPKLVLRRVREKTKKPFFRRLQCKGRVTAGVYHGKEGDEFLLACPRGGKWTSTFLSPGIPGDGPRRSLQIEKREEDSTPSPLIHACPGGEKRPCFRRSLYYHHPISKKRGSKL